MKNAKHERAAEDKVARAAQDEGARVAGKTAQQTTAHESGPQSKLKRYTLGWSPQSGPQQALMRCECPEVFFGGARGGGKTDGVLGKWLFKARRYGAAFNAMMFRKTTVASQDAIERSQEIYGPAGGRFVNDIWRMPGGGRVGFGYLDALADADAWQGRNHAPAGDGCCWLLEVHGSRVPAPAAYGDADDAGSFGGKLKATGRRHREPCDLGDHRAEPAMPQSLFKAYENRLLVTRVYVNDTMGPETGLGDGGREEVVACYTPQDLALWARSDPRGEQRSRRTVNGAIAAAGPSCSAPSASPPSGRCRSMALMPNGNTVR